MNIHNRKGQGLTEYIVLVALLVVASIGIVEVLGSTIKQRIAIITAKLQGRSVTGVKDTEEVRERLYRKRSLRDFWKFDE